MRYKHPKLYFTNHRLLHPTSQFMRARDLDDMTPTAYVEPPEPPTELLGLVSHQVSPAMQEVNESLVRFDYAHTDPGALSDAEITASGLLVVRGLTLDTLFPDSAEGRSAWKASQR
jgi:hypothetical protein